MTRPVGERPSAFEIAQKALEENAALRAAFTTMVARIEILERHAGGAGDDGHALPPLDPDRWKPIKEAAAILGYSQSGLRKFIRRWESRDQHSANLTRTYPAFR
jgi:hypothetical protein